MIEIKRKRNIETLSLIELATKSDEEVKDILKECLINYRSRHQSVELFACPICFEEVTVDKVFTLDCGHKCCLDCFKENVKAIVTSEDVREREKIKWKIP